MKILSIWLALSLALAAAFPGGAAAQSTMLPPDGILVDSAGNIVLPGTTLYVNSSKTLFLQDSGGFGYIRDTNGLHLGYGSTNVVGITSAGVSSTLPVAVSADPAAGWQDDVTSQPGDVVAAGASLALPVGSGEIIVNDIATGDVGAYLCGGNACILIGSTGGHFVAPTTSPAAGKFSVAYNGSTYAIYNNYGSSATFNIKLTRTRAFH